MSRILLAAVVLIGCVPKSYQEAQTTTESRVTVMTTRQALLEQSLDEQIRKLEQVQTALRARGQSEAEALQNLEQVADRLRAIQGQAEESRFQLEDLQRDFRGYIEQQERRQLHDEIRLREIEKSLRLPTPPLPELDPAKAVPGTDTAEPTLDAALPPTAKGKLEKAVAEMQEGRQGVARFLLQRAIELHPDDALQSELRYRLGETWANEGQWARAASAFDQVVSNYPKSTWAPWAMLRTGEAFLQLGQRDGATLFFEDTIRLYPKSEAATEAKAKLKEVK
jgi:TolA-binding protein